MEPILLSQKNMKMKCSRVALSLVLASIIWSLTFPFTAKAQVKTVSSLSTSDIKDMSSSERFKYFTSILKPSQSDLATPGTDLRKSFLEKQKENLETNALKLMGGVDSGGGTIVLKSGIPSLLDFYNFPLENDSRLPGNPILTPSSDPSCTLHTFQFDKLSMSSTIFEILAPLLIYAKDFPRQTLVNAYMTTPVSFIERRFTSQALDTKSYLPSESKDFSLLPAAIYIKGLGILISQPTFNSMPYYHQIGLLIHELLRQMSIGFELAIPDIELQQWTSQLVQGKISVQKTKDFHSEFEKTDLPSDLFVSLFTPYIIKADLSYLCHWMAREKGSLGPSCQALQSASTQLVYSYVAQVREEVLSLYIKDDTDITEQKRRDIWHSLVLQAHSYRKTYSLYWADHSVLNLFSQNNFIENGKNKNIYCSEFTQALVNEGLIEKKNP